MTNFRTALEAAIAAAPNEAIAHDLRRFLLKHQVVANSGSNGPPPKKPPVPVEG